MDSSQQEQQIRQNSLLRGQEHEEWTQSSERSKCLLNKVALVLRKQTF